MKRTVYHSILSAVICLAILSVSAGASAPSAGPDNDYIVSGAIGVAAKYDSNLNLIRKTSANDLAADFINEVLGRLSVKRGIGNRAWLETRLAGLANWHVENTEKNWFFGRIGLSLGYPFGKSDLGFSNELRNYTIPKEDDVGFLRNTAILTYRRTLSPRWQWHMGYENIATFYPENTPFNYIVNGAFLEVRNTRSVDFSTYYAYDFQFYQGSYDAELDDPTGSPEEGFRHTFKLGFDWVFDRNVLNVSYLFQMDNSSGEGLNLNGGFEGNEESLDVDAEFDFVKHKATLLYSRRLSGKLTLSSYGEFILKDLSDRHSPALGLHDRNDTLFLSSTYLKYKLKTDWLLKVRYLLRIRQSSIDSEDYQDHLLFFGTEYRF